MSKICIIIPCYNEQLRLDCKYLESFAAENINVDFCFVNDGSTDKTLEMLNVLVQKAPDRFLIVNQRKNQGKAEAVRTGMLNSLEWKDFEYLGFWDADFSTPLTELKRLIKPMQEDLNLDIAIGSRVKRLGAVIYRKYTRHIMGRIFSTFSSLILRLPVYDSQCGAKIFRSTLVRTVFTDPFYTAWLFDVELLARLRNTYGIEMTLNKVVEIPLEHWKEVGGSKIGLRHFIKVPFQLFKIYKMYNKNVNTF